MLSKTILAFAGMVAAAQAIMVTSPTKDEKLDFSKSIEVKWTYVSTDPTTFDLVLVDQSNMTPIPVADNVKTSDGQYTLTNFVATPGAKYKFNLLSDDPQNTGILAQSQTFEITKSGGTTTSSSSSEEDGTTTSTTEPSSTETDAGAEETDSSSTSSATETTKTTASTPSKTGSTTASETADASSSTTPVPSDNAAAAVNGKTFGVAGGLVAGLLMLL